MSNMKKRISVIMAAAMAMSMAVTPVHAEDAPHADSPLQAPEAAEPVPLPEYCP